MNGSGLQKTPSNEGVFVLDKSFVLMPNFNIEGSQVAYFGKLEEEMEILLLETDLDELNAAISTQLVTDYNVFIADNLLHAKFLLENPRFDVLLTSGAFYRGHKSACYWQDLVELAIRAKVSFIAVVDNRGMFDKRLGPEDYLSYMSDLSRIVLTNAVNSAGRKDWLRAIRILVDFGFVQPFPLQRLA